MNTYVLWTETGKENYVRDLLEKSLHRQYPHLRCKLTVFEKPYFQHNSPAVKEKLGEEFTLLHKVLFPGYLFVETEDIMAFYKALPSLNTTTRYRLLARKDEQVTPLNEDELQWIGYLSEKTPSRATLKDGRLVFLSGSLVGLDSYVRKVNKRNRCVMLNLPFLGEPKDIWIAVCFEDSPEGEGSTEKKKEAVEKAEEKKAEAGKEGAKETEKESAKKETENPKKE